MTMSSEIPPAQQVSDSAEVPHLAGRTVSEHITVHPDEEMLAAIDFEVAEHGLLTRSQLVQHAVSHYLGQQKRKRIVEAQPKTIYQTSSGRKICIPRDTGSSESRQAIPTVAPPSPNQTSFESHIWPEGRGRLISTAEKEMADVVYYIFFGEETSRKRDTKVISLRKFFKDYEFLEEVGREDTWSAGQAFSIHRSVLPWLIAELQSVEEAIRMEVAKNRQSAQEKRTLRDAEEILQEKELRRQYVEKYSDEQVLKSRTLATRHKARAIRYQQFEHFTWWEWLDLCACSQFCCPTCAERSPLTPHHLLALSRGGTNTIANIEPVCRTCHGQIEGMEKFTEAWLAQEHDLFGQFSPGDLVRLSTRSYRECAWTTDTNVEVSPGVVVRMVAPEPPTGPLWAYEGRSGYAHFHDSPQYRNRVETKAVVRWEDGEEETLRPNSLDKFDPEVWNAEQQSWLARQHEFLGSFQEGDIVRRWYGQNLSKALCTIVRLIAPRCAPLWGQRADGTQGFMQTPAKTRSEAKVRIRWTKNDTTKYSVVELHRLVKVQHPGATPKETQQNEITILTASDGIKTECLSAATE